MAQAGLTATKALVASEQGDYTTALREFRAALALHEADGDTGATSLYMSNIGSALLSTQRTLEAIAVLAPAYQQAMSRDQLRVVHYAGDNLSLALSMAGLPQRAAQLAREQLATDLPQPKRTWQRDDWKVRAVAELGSGDYASALNSLRAADALADPKDASSSDFLDRCLYESIAAFQAQPAHLLAVQRVLDKLHATASTPRGLAHRKHLLHALEESVASHPRRADRWLQSAAVDTHVAGDADVELRMVPLLIAIRDYDRTAAGIALQGYDPSTTTDASLLPSYIRWARQIGVVSMLGVPRSVWPTCAGRPSRPWTPPDWTRPLLMA